MNVTQTKIQQFVDEAVRRIVARFHPERIILFGSCARGTPTQNSDIDVLVVMPVERSNRKKASEIDLALADRTVSMDIIVVTPEQFDRQRDMMGTVVREAAHEGKVLYERAA